jgi:Fe2+ transport system protein FeoA
MTKSELPTQEWNLVSAARGQTVVVIDIGDEHAQALLVQGIRPGVAVTIDGDAPFGGPRIVRFGGSRVAIDRRLARTIRVAPR